MRFSLRNAAARVPGRITPMLAIPTPDFAVPYAAPTHENTNADAAPINPKNGATASPESSVDSADTRVASEASATAKSIVIEEEIPFFIWPVVFCREELFFFFFLVVVVVVVANRSKTFFLPPSSLRKKGNVVKVVVVPWWWWCLLCLLLESSLEKDGEGHASSLDDAAQKLSKREKTPFFFF